MPRIVKDAAERKNELMDVAEKLFSEKGYDDTSIEDIISIVGIAKGTFYHHFKSKEKLMEALIERQVTRLQQSMVGDIRDDSLKAGQKLELLIRSTMGFKSEKDVFVDFIYRDDNFALRTKFFRKLDELTTPLLVGLLEQGIREGVFHVEYPRETVKLLTLMLDNMKEYERIATTHEERYKCTRALETVIERILGMNPGSIRLIH